LDPVHFRQINQMLATHIKPFDAKLVQEFHRAPLFVILLRKRCFNRFKRHRNFDLQWLQVVFVFFGNDFLRLLLLLVLKQHLPADCVNFAVDFLQLFVEGYAVLGQSAV